MTESKPQITPSERYWGSFSLIGFEPFYERFLTTGLHNIIPEPLRKYVPTFDNTLNPIFTPLFGKDNPTKFPLGFKAAPLFLYQSQE